MDKPILKICSHFKLSHLKKNKTSLLDRNKLYCDSCFSTHKFKKSKEGLDLANLLVCLNCFKICCNRYTKHQCMLNHGRESTHLVTYSLSQGAIWCYGCDYELKEFQIEKGLNCNPDELETILNGYSVDDTKVYKLLNFTKEVDEIFNKLIEKNRKKMIEQQSEQIDLENQKVIKKPIDQSTHTNKITHSSVFKFSDKLANIWAI